MTYINIKTPIPGPKATEWLARRDKAISSGLARATDVVAEKAVGIVVEDVDGNRLLDFAGGIGMLAVGHCPPAVAKALQEQSERLIHLCAIVGTYDTYVRLAELLNEVTPGDFPKKTLVSSSGAEAVENAIKFARAYTSRPGVLVFEGAYHGRTLLTMSCTSKYGLFKKNFGPFAPEIYRIPAPHPYRRPASMSEQDYVDWTIGQLENALVAQVDPTALAAILIEPVQGEAGFIPMPGKFLRRIRELCDEHGIVMIADEIQCGMGRTGKLFAMEHYGIAADLVTMAKSLGAGMPVSAVTGRSEIMDAAHLGGVGGTYGGSPMAAAAAIAAVEMIREPAFLRHGEQVGALMQRHLESWHERFPLVGDVRGLGPMRLVEFVSDRETKEPAPADTLQIIKSAGASGVILIRAGLYSNGIRFMPPLNAPLDAIDEGMELVGQAVEAQQAVVEQATSH